MSSLSKAASLVALAVPLSFAALAAERKAAFHLPAGEAPATLKQFVEQSAVQVFYVATDVAGVRTNAVAGELSARQALDLMLTGTPLRVTEDDKTGALAVAVRKK